MNNTEFIKAVAAKTNKSQRETKEFLEAVNETFMENIKSDGGVTPIPGVKVSAVYKEPYMGRNPMTGEPVQVAGRYQAKVKFGSAIKKAINN